jgi:hypothetical protein
MKSTQVKLFTLTDATLILKHYQVITVVISHILEFKKDIHLTQQLNSVKTFTIKQAFQQQHLHASSLDAILHHEHVVKNLSHDEPFRAKCKQGGKLFTSCGIVRANSKSQLPVSLPKRLTAATCQIAVASISSEETHCRYTPNRSRQSLFRRDSLLLHAKSQSIVSLLKDSLLLHAKQQSLVSLPMDSLSLHAKQQSIVSLSNWLMHSPSKLPEVSHIPSMSAFHSKLPSLNTATSHFQRFNPTFDGINLGGLHAYVIAYVIAYEAPCLPYMARLLPRGALPKWLLVRHSNVPEGNSIQQSGILCPTFLPANTTKYISVTSQICHAIAVLSSLSTDCNFPFPFYEPASEGVTASMHRTYLHPTDQMKPCNKRLTSWVYNHQSQVVFLS